MNIGIVGGGLMGLAVAQRLASQGHKTVVYEQEQQVGGLTTWHDFGGVVWDKFYHVILPSDSHLIRFIGDLGLGDELRWQTTRTGFFVDRKLYSLSSGLEFLKFPPLSLWSKFRLGAGILYGSKIDDWRRLEAIPVADWLVRVFGRATYEKLWKPLLLAKLGVHYERVSAVFIWSYITRMFSARDGSAQKEQLGYVRGGYKTVFARVRQAIEARGGEIRAGATVESIAPGEQGMEVRVDGTVQRHDKVICTSPTNVLNRIASPELIVSERSGANVEYLGVVCVVLKTTRPLLPYYVLNIADERVPFTGVIGMSNVVDASETGGRYITYLPKYVLSTEDFLKLPDSEIADSFLAGLRLIFDDLDESCIEDVYVNRAFKVQPLQVLNYSSIVPSVSAAHADFYILNTSQFVNNTLNNNEVVRAVDEFIESHGREFAARDATPGAAAAG